MMKDWRKALIAVDLTIFDTLKVIDDNTIGIALVVDAQNRLLGTITDGDIRRAILNSVALTEQASTIMNKNPIVAHVNDARKDILFMMRQKDIKQVPVLDEAGRVIHLEVLSELIKKNRKENWVVLMAGGLGTRLQPLTNDCPKPMLKVGGKPVLETIIENFISYGFYKFFIAVNYKAEIIEAYFGNGRKWDVEINYLQEQEKLGTAGALSLLPNIPDKPLIVMNGDLLTKVNFSHLLDFHQLNNSAATMCVREYKIQVPYGVVSVAGHRLERILEKPEQKFFVSAGVYALEPKILSLISKNQVLDMPNLFNKLIAEQYATSVFPVREYWLDIGRKEDFTKANDDFMEGFL